MRRIEKRRFTKKQLDSFLFFFAYSLYLITAIVNISFLIPGASEYGKTTMVVCASIVIFKELLLYRLNKKETFYLLVSSLLSLIIFLHTNGFLMFPLFILIYGSRRIDFSRIAKFSLIVLSILFAIVVICAKTGLIVDYTSFANGRERDYLGFRYALFPSMIGLNIIALATYLNKENKITKYAFLLLFSYLLFEYTDSRLSFAISLLIIVSVFLIRKYILTSKNRNKLFRITPFTYIICSVISLTLVFTFSINNPVMRSIDEKVEHRISLGNSSLNSYPVNLLGHNVEYVGAGLNENGKRSNKEYNYVDCLYLNLLEKYGAIYLIAYIAILTRSMMNLEKRKDYVLLIIMCLFAIIGMLDDLGMFLHYNTFLFAASAGFLPQNIKGAKK